MGWKRYDCTNRNAIKRIGIAKGKLKVKVKDSRSY